MTNTNLIGQTHLKILDWLSNEWFQSGPPISFLEGFPGVGKTTVARALIEKVAPATNMVPIMITIPDDIKGDPTDDIQLYLEQELNVTNRKELPTIVGSESSLSDILTQILEHPILIVIDEFQRVMHSQSGQPINEFARVLNTLSNRHWLKGRILLLSNRIVERARWSEGYEILTLGGLLLHEAEEFLDMLLTKEGRQDEIPLERRRDVVNWLGGNPRALRTLVASLMYDSLETLIGLRPEMWEVKDRYVSPTLVAKLEYDLLERAINRLSDEDRLRLRQLAVYRKAFQIKAIENLFTDESKPIQFRNSLINRFLMEHHNGWYNLHPIAKGISLQRLKESPRQLRQTHAIVASYYTRHFLGQRILEDVHSRLGGHFVEARYHLINANDLDTLNQVISRFETYLDTFYSNTRSLPYEESQLDEQIVVLTTLAKIAGSTNIHYRLIQLFRKRDHPGDLEAAIEHARHILNFHTSAEKWLFCMRMLLQAGEIDEAVTFLKAGNVNVPTKDIFRLYEKYGKQLIKNGRLEEARTLYQYGIQKSPTSHHPSRLYMAYSQLLIKQNKITEAIKLLEIAIHKDQRGHQFYPVDLCYRYADLLVRVGQVEEAISSLYDGISKASSYSHPLYLKCGELLAQVGRIDEAINLLQEGLTKTPVDNNLSSLYQSCGDLLVQADRINEAISLLQEGIGKIPVDKHLASLYLKCGELLAQIGRMGDAIALLQRGIAKIPVDKDLVSLYRKCGDLLTQIGRLDDAIALLQEGIAKIPVDKDLVSLYRKCGELLTQIGRIDEAISLLQRGMDKIPVDKHLVSLYLKCSELLTQIGRADEAILLLQEGIAKIPVDKSLFSLYLKCGELLAQADRVDDAITLLQDGMAKIPGDKHLVSLYRKCGELLTQAGRVDDAMLLFQEGIAKIPVDKHLFSLYLKYGDLLTQVGRLDDAIALLQEGMTKIPGDKHLVSLYHKCGELLMKAGRVDDAIALLQEGITKIPVDKNLFSLYHSFGELLTRVGRLNEAIALLQEGIAKIPVDKHLVSLYHSCGELLTQAGRLDEAITLFQQGILRIPRKHGRASIEKITLVLLTAMGKSSTINQLIDSDSVYQLQFPSIALGQIYLYQMQQAWDKAARRAAKAQASYGHLLPLLEQEVFSWLAAGNPERARLALTQHPQPINYKSAWSCAWLQAFISVIQEQPTEARKYVSYLKYPLPKETVVDRSLLLTIWDRPSTPWGEHDLAFHFPTLPPSLTGLETPVTRVFYRPSVLPDDVKTQPGPSPDAPISMESQPIMNETIEDKRKRGAYDVFLCHNDADKPAVKRIGQELMRLGILPWLDEWDIQPGRRWQDALQKQIGRLKVVAVFVGPSGIGPWQNLEIDGFLVEFVNRGTGMIPVVLPECQKTPTLPIFLKGFQWVDFRKQEPDPFRQLIWGITGKQPASTPDLFVPSAAQPEKPDLLADIQRIVRQENERVREALITKLDQTSAETLRTLNHSQISIINALTIAIEERQIQEDDVTELLEAIGELRHNLPTDQSIAAALQSLPPLVDDPKANVYSKLKVTVPIIPLLISYEGEYELSTGINLNTILQKVAQRIRR